MRNRRLNAVSIPLCLILFGSACNMPITWPDEYHELYEPNCSNPCTFPVSTNAVIGFPWENIDLGSADALGYYRGYVAVGDSVVLYYASKSGANIPPAGLDTVRSAYWVVAVQSTADTSGNVYDVRGDPAVAVMERREDGRGVLKPRKSGYFLRPMAHIDGNYIGATVYGCRGAECVKVEIVSR